MLFLMQKKNQLPGTHPRQPVDSRYRLLAGDSSGLNDAGLDEGLTLKLVESLHLRKQFGVVSPAGQPPVPESKDLEHEGGEVPPELTFQLEHAAFEADLEALQELRALLRVEENSERLFLLRRNELQGKALTDD